jgi:steroid delta-isomerase
MSTPALTTALEQYIAFMNTLEQPDALSQIEQLTTPDVRFVDPFNDLTGQAGFYQAMKDFIKEVQNPRFEVRHRGWDGNTVLIQWHFTGTFKRSGKPWAFPGTTEILFDDHAKVKMHYDHWDSGQHFYQHLPVTGWAIRWIRRKIAIRPSD